MKEYKRERRGRDWGLERGGVKTRKECEEYFWEPNEAAWLKALILGRSLQIDLVNHLGPKQA